MDLKILVTQDLKTQVRRIADEIGYEPRGRTEMRKLADELSQRPLPIGRLGASLDLLKEFLVEHLPDLAPTQAHEMADLKADILGAAARIGFGGYEWDKLANELNIDEVLDPTTTAWTPNKLKQFCSEHFEGFTDNVWKAIQQIDVSAQDCHENNFQSLNRLLLDGSSNRQNEIKDELGLEPSAFFDKEEINRTLADDLFKGRLVELLNRFDVENDRDTVPMKDYFKWKMQVQWFLHQSLGPGNPYAREFTATLGRDLDPYSNAREIIAGKGILEALLVDFSEGWLILGSRSIYQ